jgi:hypothetical protein
MTLEKCYAVRQFRSGKIVGSRLMTEAEATREVATWRAEIGRAGVVAADLRASTAVRKEDQAELARLLDEAEPHVWIATTSHRSRERLAMAYRLAGDPFGPGQEHFSWPHGGRPHGAYYLVNTRHLDAIRRIKGIRVLQAEPSALHKCWTSEGLGGPVRGQWQVSAS